MKRKILNYSSIFMLLVVIGCCPEDKSIKIVSLGEVAIQSKLENVNPTDSLDASWVDELKTLHELDQAVCLLAAESTGGVQKSEFITEASAQGNERGTAVRVMESCCPCSGGCCGCVDGFGSSDQVTGLSITTEAEPKKTVNAKNEPIGKINVFRFDPAEVGDGEYIMSILLKDGKEIKFRITFKGSNWTTDRP